MSNVNQTALIIAPEFQSIEQQLAISKKDNSSLVFDYESKQGEKEARSHIALLRKNKALINEAHKKAKADILIQGKALDSGKNYLLDQVEEMIAVHMGPITIKTERIEAEALAESLRLRDEALKIRAENEAKEMAFKRETDHEFALFEDEKRTFAKEQQQARFKLEATIEAEQAANQKVLDQQAATAAAQLKAEQAEQAAKQAVINAQRETERVKKAAELEKQEAVNQEKRRVAAETLAAETAKKKREANIEHQRPINQAIHRKMLELGLDSVKSRAFITAMARGQVPYVSINY